MAGPKVLYSVETSAVRKADSLAVMLVILMADQWVDSTVDQWTQMMVGSSVGRRALYSVVKKVVTMVGSLVVQ